MLPRLDLWAVLQRTVRAEAVLASVLCIVGCGSTTTQKRSDGPAAETPPAEPSPTWSYHPTKPELILARLALGQGELLTDAGGTRWLKGEHGPRPAATGTPEPLVAIGRETGKFLFLGQEGTVHISRSPLGPFVETREPPEAWVDAAALGEELLGISVLGRLYRSPNWGRTWHAQAPSGFFTSVESGDGGVAVLASAPEAWHVLDAGAEEPRRLSVLPVGVRALWSEGQRVIVEAALGTFAVGPSGLVATPAPRRTVSWKLPSRPAARDVILGRVALGKTTVALEKVSGPEGSQLAGAHAVRISGGEFGGPPASWSTAPIDCPGALLARGGRNLALACLHPRKKTSSFRLRLHTGQLSEDGMLAGPLAVRDIRARSRGDQLLLAVSERGTVALFGACPNRADARDHDCADDTAVFVIEEDHLLATGISAGAGPSALSFFPGSEVLASAVVREKDHHVLVYHRDLTSETPVRTLDLTRRWGMVSSENVVVRLHPGEAGLLGIATSGQGGSTVAVMDSRGEVLAAGQVPGNALSVSGAGANFLALAGDQSTFWESQTGGLTWTRAQLPRPVCLRTEQCTPLVACSSEGCLVGEELSRLGWREPPQQGGREMLRVSREVAKEENLVPRYRCRKAGASWQPLPQLTAFPSASDAALGRSDWAQVEADWATGEVRFVGVDKGGDRIKRVQALPPVLHPERYALHVSPQIEGAAVVRYEVPADASGQLRNFEVAWDNRIRNISGRGNLPGGLAARTGDFRAADGEVGRAFVGLISVAGDGLYLRPHRSFEPQDVTYYFEGHKSETLLPVAWPDVGIDPNDAEYIRLGERHVPLVFSPSRQEVVISSGEGDRPPFIVARLLSPHAQDPRLAQGVGIGYLGDKIGIVAKFARASGEEASASFSELRDDGLSPAVPVPLKSDLAAPLVACSPAQKQTSPRVVAPEFPGPAPAVRLDQVGEDPLQMTARRAVLHGTPEVPCVAAWEASPSVPVPPTKEEIRLLILPRPGRIDGWAFRALPQRDGRRDVSAVSLECVPR